MNPVERQLRTWTVTFTPVVILAIWGLVRWA